MENCFLDLIGDFGYIGMFFSMILEAIIIIIPSELILATSGILAANGTFSFFGAFLTGLIGSVFCASIIYFIGYYGGRSFIKKYGKYFFMKKEDLEKSDIWFEKYGMKAALIGRNFPIIRTFISLPIGISRLSFLKFLLYTTIGSIPWTFIFVFAGFYLGEKWVVIASFFDKIKAPIIVISIVIFIYFVISRIFKNRIKYINLKRK